MAAALELTPTLGAGAACRAMGLWRGVSARQQARVHRCTAMGPPRPRAPCPCPPLALDASERQAVLDTLNSERFADTAPAAVHATLLDEGTTAPNVGTAHSATKRRSNKNDGGRSNNRNHITEAPQVIHRRARCLRMRRRTRATVDNLLPQRHSWRPSNGDSSNLLLDIDVADQGVLFMIGAAHRNCQGVNANSIITGLKPLRLQGNVLNQHPAKEPTMTTQATRPDEPPRRVRAERRG